MDMLCRKIRQRDPDTKLIEVENFKSYAEFMTHVTRIRFGRRDTTPVQLISNETVLSLCRSKTLKHLCLHNLEIGYLLATFSVGLALNGSIETLIINDFYLTMISESCWERLAKTMETQYTLKYFCLGYSINFMPAPYATMQTYCKLNREGRGAIISDPNSSLEDWIRLIIIAKDDLDVLLCILRERPNLCKRNESHKRSASGSRLPARNKRQRH
jgi:hypothetical protein